MQDRRGIDKRIDIKKRKERREEEERRILRKEKKNQDRRGEGKRNEKEFEDTKEQKN